MKIEVSLGGNRL